jgi:6-phosphogluconate dehydrogenase (decarboxylating)
VPTKTPMQLGMVGLGRMGAGLVGRVMRDGHRCVGYDVSPDAVKGGRASHRRPSRATTTAAPTAPATS